MLPFHPKAAGTASLAVTTASANVAMPRAADMGSFQVRIYNAGPSTVFVAFGGAAVVATTNDLPIPPGTVEVFTRNNVQGSPSTTAAAITGSGTATVYFTVGEGV